MENRRYTSTNSEKNFTKDNKDQYQRRTDDRPYGERKFQPRDNSNYRPRDDRNQPRDNRFQPRDNRFQPRERINQSNQSRDEKFQPRENRFQPRDNRGGGISGRPVRNDDRFQSRDTRFQSRDNRYDPRKRFAPKGKVEPWKQIVKPKIVSDMQVTDGKHAGKYLTSTTSPKVRPTMRKMRETMLKIVARRIRGGRFLDLCSGSGAVGFEAISRGALLGTFVERSAKMVSFIKKNMEALGIKEGHAEIFEIEAVPFLKQMAKRRRFWDVVFLDPPYDSNYDEILKYLGRGVCVKPKGMLVIEHHAEMFFPEKLGVLTRWRVIVEGDSALSFYDRA